jgi:uncharacterized membrane protein affecting hemolysin expression
MAMVVFKVEPSQAAALQQLTSDETVSRQSIHTRDGKTLGLAGNHLYVRVQGSEAGVVQAIDAEEDAAAEGMGMIFGG